MHISSAKFIKGIVRDDESLEDGTPQIAFMGRSNVGKSTMINSLTQQKGLAKTSSFPGRTTELNLFLINKSFYLVDLPGYGFAQASREGREKIQRLIFWYIMHPRYEQKKIVLIMDAYTGPTESDIEMLHILEEQGKDIVIVANKVDKIKKSEYKKKLQKIEDISGINKVIPYSSEKKIGVNILLNEILI